MFILWVKMILVLQNISLGFSSCNDPPAIKYTEKVLRASPPFSEGSTINYSCLSGYEPYGSGIFTCLNGHWNGLFNCTVRKCPSLEPPGHGRMINPCKEVACVTYFFCDEGYQRDGPESSYCRVNGSWSHAVPNCHIMKCPPPPFIEHGNLTGVGVHVFGTTLSVKCNEGFIRSGSSRIECDNNGQWTQAPACLSSICSEYSGLDDECVEKTQVQRLWGGGFLLFIYCTENGTFTGMNNDPVTCSNGNWDDQSIRCYCSCKVNVISEEVLFENFNLKALLKHGETLKWSCKDGYYMNETSDLLVCDDGKIGTPKCFPNTENEIEKPRYSGIAIWLSLGSTFMVATMVIIIICILKGRYSRLMSLIRKSKTDEEASKTTQSLVSDENTHSRKLNERNWNLKTRYKE